MSIYIANKMLRRVINIWPIKRLWLRLKFGVWPPPQARYLSLAPPTVADMEYARKLADIRRDHGDGRCA